MYLNPNSKMRDTSYHLLTNNSFFHLYFDLANLILVSQFPQCSLRCHIAFVLLGLFFLASLCVNLYWMFTNLEREPILIWDILTSISNDIIIILNILKQLVLFIKVLLILIKLVILNNLES